MVYWTYEGNVVTTPPADALGFIYILKYDDGTKAYIGKKTISSKKTIPALLNGELRGGAERIVRLVYRSESGNIITSKKDKAAARKKGIKAKKEKFDVLYVESNWQAYESSSDDVKGHKLVSKEILQWVPTQQLLSYYENKWLYSEGVIERQEYLNKNISGMFYQERLFPSKQKEEI